ncbi:MAG: phosphate acyltransferase PlsX [Acidobacteria bacterium]|nr:phosphate acyltransferase PlsX [Acidobacteriota bacterium]
MRIAVDAMGGDFAPRTIVDGAIVAARHLGVGLTLVGRITEVEQALAAHGSLAGLDVRLADAPDVIGMAESPSASLRRKPRASVKVAAELVARGDAAAMFTAGNTGAALMAAYGEFGLLPGVDRPALAATIPARDAAAVLLDSGANAECRPPHLVQFATMGALFARMSLGVERPRVGLLSIGEEETKGNDLTREAHRLLKASVSTFIGNVEARDLYTGQADVIVCDGFTGNIALKVSEGLVEVVEALLTDELSRTFTTRVGLLLSRRAFRRFRKRVDYSESGGAPLLGVAGLCIVGHGRSSAKAVRNAVAMAARLSSQHLIERLEQEIATPTLFRP